MKKKYEEPEIITEIFSTEILNAKCTVGPGDVQLVASYVYYAYLGYNCSCAGTTTTAS